MLIDSGKSLEQAFEDWHQWLPGQQPLLITPLDDGLSHQSFLIASGGCDYVLRINNPHSQQLALGLTQEERLLHLAQAQGIGAKVIHYCPDYLVTEYIAAESWLLEYSSDTELQQLAQHLKQIHQLSIDDDFDLITHCQNYWQKIKTPTSTQRKLHKICFEQLTTTLKNNPQRCLCHNDFSGENLLRVAEGFITLDWEYAGRNHPDCDIATLVELGNLAPNQQRSLLTAYWGEINDTLLHNLDSFRIIVRYVQWLWLLLQPQLQENATEVQQILSAKVLAS